MVDYNSIAQHETVRKHMKWECDNEYYEVAITDTSLYIILGGTVAYMPLSKICRVEIKGNSLMISGPGTYNNLFINVSSEYIDGVFWIIQTYINKIYM